MFANEVSRRLLFRSAAAAAVSAVTGAEQSPSRNPLLKVSGPPSLVRVFAENGSMTLQKTGSRWHAQEIELGILPEVNGSLLTLRSPKSALLRIHLRWRLQPPLNLQYLGDAWERSYGDLEWRSLEPERILPWYFLAFDGSSTVGCGVKTGAAAFCFWQVDSEGVSLWLDVRNGGRGVKLGSRQIHLASVVAEFYPETKPFAAAKRFCRILSPTCLMPEAPVYGGNNWYYAYGKSSAADIRSDSARIANLAPSSTNRPFMVIDDGWQPNPTAGPWSNGNAKFPDMAHLAADMRRTGVRPGLWMRPLFTKEEIPAGWRLRSPNANAELQGHHAYTIDPSVPEALQKVKLDLQTAAGWGYEMIKHDFSTYDLLGRWGFNMGAAITDSGWSFANQSLTSAEIILSFYRALREAAGNAMLIGCNTVGHLGAGFFELQRIGDDTSGRDWDRTRKMGVNTLAFRAPQHGTFFAVDADCVGITKEIAWSFNRQWLDLLARGGTPLFVSAAPDAVGPEQRSAIKAAFEVAAKPAPLLEPVDWLNNTEPQEWLLSGQKTQFQWFGQEGVSPFST